jgi:hypothetical protein
MTTEKDDLKQIGLTAEAKQQLDLIMEKNWFEERQDAVRVAIALALAADVIATEDQVRGSVNAYNFVGGIDRDGKVRRLIELYRPDEAKFPARAAERLAHAGLPILASRLIDGDRLLSEALGYQSDVAPTTGPMQAQ